MEMTIILGIVQVALYIVLGGLVAWFKTNGKLNKMVVNSTPNVLDDVLAKCESENLLKKKEIKMKEKQKNRFLIPKLAGALVVIIVCIGGLVLFRNQNRVYDSIINFDVNPSIELKIDNDREVISAIALNDDGMKVLDNMDLDDVSLNVAVNAIIGSMLKNGYLTVSENSILVSVKNKDVDKANALKEEISNDISAILNASSINASILSQAYDDDANAQNLATENNISEGKARLISNIISSNITDSKGNLYTFDTLKDLSINELNLLVSSKNATVKDTQKTGEASSSSYITRDSARDIAINAAGVSLDNIRALEVELDADDGRLVYEVEFKSGDSEYDYEIDAKSGEIIKNHVEIDDDYQTSSGNNSSSNSGNTSTNTPSTSRPNYDDDDWDDRYDDDDDDWDDRYDDDDDDDDWDDRYDDDDHDDDDWDD